MISDSFPKSHIFIIRLHFELIRLHRVGDIWQSFVQKPVERLYMRVRNKLELLAFIFRQLAVSDSRCLSHRRRRDIGEKCLQIFRSHFYKEKGMKRSRSVFIDLFRMIEWKMGKTQGKQILNRFRKKNIILINI